MSTTHIVGLLWIVVAGVTQGAFVLPMKHSRSWKWEHLWFWFSILAFFVLPLIVTYLTVPKLTEVYSVAPLREVGWAAVFGLAWGAGSVLFGLGVDALGMALGFSIMTALYTALGAFIPLAVLTPDAVFERHGLVIITGNLVTVLGVTLCALAGGRRAKLLGDIASQGMIGPKRSFTTALTICVLSGILSAAFNFGYAFCSELIETAERLGATKDNAVGAMWVVLVPTGGLVNVGYCLFLLRRNRSWGRLIVRSASMDWLGVCTMAVLWTGSVFVYGWGANDLGKLGATLGWSLWNAILIATTFFCGLLTHEWKGVHGRPLQVLYGGIAVMVVGMFVLGLGLGI
jgi:L-rhamnose-H+ transport protein